ncbi:BatD family protein [Candidatus Halobeggiatoa sp. HSG11]|nr:BatD family protein [Candidatus Halobeggiatoa sp. HSG11]
MLVVILLLIISFPAVAAPQLNAIVDSNKVMLGESFTLTIELSNAKPIGEPDLSALKDKFSIYSPQRSHSTKSINGKVSSQIVWQYYLETQVTGTLLIPALKLKTDVGYLQTKPIKMTVTSNPTKRSDNIRLETVVSNSNPYLHEPIIYTLRLYHKGELQDLEPIPPSNDVMMEQLQNKIISQRKIVNGQQVIIAQMTYLLTPLRSGKLRLNAGRMKGLKQDNNRSGSFFSFNNYRQITINSSPVTLEVKSPATPQPWLPLQNLKLSQNWESDIAKSVTVGTPLVLTLKLIAEGMGGQAPPKLENFFQNTADFKVRSPKPEIERTFLQDRKIPASTITSSFSIIPTNIGDLELPAIRIPWWNLQTKQLAWVELPAQTIKVIASKNNISTNEVPTKIVQQHIVVQQLAFTNTQYICLIFSIFVLLIALWQSWYSRHHVTIPKIKIGMSNSNFKRRLMKLEELTEIRALIQEYVHLRWQIPKNSSLQTIANHLPMSHELTKLFNELNAAMYGKQDFNLLNWKQHCIDLFLQVKAEKASQPEKIIFNPLNPV